MVAEEDSECRHNIRVIERGKEEQRREEGDV